MNLWIIFITGLTVGGLTCLAVQGGLLASVVAARKEEEVEKEQVSSKKNIFPTLTFLLAKLIAHAIFGFLLGAFGSVLRISQSVQILMQLAAGLYMIAIALNLLNIHPIFRYAVIQPPKFLTKRVKNQSKSKELFAPAFLGAMTIFIPCGTTLAMEALAVSSANALMGALIMTTFVLGTVPMFLGIGWFTGILSENFRNKFLKLAAIGIIYLGLTSINGGLIALDFPINSQTLFGNLMSREQSDNDEKLGKSSEAQKIEIIVSSSGYSPNYFKVMNGLPVSVKLTSKDSYSCASAFRIPSLGIAKNLTANETYSFTFTPTKAEKIRFSCSMGMYTGVIEVI